MGIGVSEENDDQVTFRLHLAWIDLMLDTGVFERMSTVVNIGGGTSTLIDDRHNNGL